MPKQADASAARRWNDLFYGQKPQARFGDLLGVSLAEQIKEVEREIAMRHRVYPNLKVKSERTAYQLRCMEAVLATLKAKQ
jgi:hypothetical protein